MGNLPTKNAGASHIDKRGTVRALGILSKNIKKESEIKQLQNNSQEDINGANNASHVVSVSPGSNIADSVDSNNFENVSLNNSTLEGNTSVIAKDHDKPEKIEHLNLSNDGHYKAEKIEQLYLSNQPQYEYSPDVDIGDEVEACWGEDWMCVTIADILENGLITVTWKSDGSQSEVTSQELRVNVVKRDTLSKNNVLNLPVGVSDHAAAVASFLTNNNGELKNISMQKGPNTTSSNLISPTSSLISSSTIESKKGFDQISLFTSFTQPIGRSRSLSPQRQSQHIDFPENLINKSQSLSPIRRGSSHNLLDILESSNSRLHSIGKQDNRKKTPRHLGTAWNAAVSEVNTIIDSQQQNEKQISSSAKNELLHPNEGNSSVIAPQTISPTSKDVRFSTESSLASIAVIKKSARKLRRHRRTKHLKNRGLGEPRRRRRKTLKDGGSRDLNESKIALKTGPHKRKKRRGRKKKKKSDSLSVGNNSEIIIKKQCETIKNENVEKSSQHEFESTKIENVVDNDSGKQAKLDETLRKLFREIDTDSSGFLDSGEIRELSIKLGMRMSDERLASAMLEMDPNGDHKVDFNEFSAWWKKNKDKKGSFAENLKIATSIGGGVVGSGYSKFRSFAGKLSKALVLMPIRMRIENSTDARNEDNLKMIRRGRVKTLSLDGSDLVEKDFEELARAIGAEKSKANSIRFLSLRGAIISNKHMGILSESFEYADYSLRHLDLHRLRQTTAVGLRKLLQATPKLETLILSYCKKVSHKWCSIVTTLVSKTIIKLDLSGCSRIDDMALSILICESEGEKGFPSLRILLLKGCRVGRGISHFAKYSPLLEVIDLSNTSAGTDEAIVKFAPSCPELISINLKVSDFSLKGCNTSSNMSTYTDRSLKALGAFCHELRTVTFTTTNPWKFVPKLRDQGIKALCSGCKLLMEIDVGYCSMLTDIAMREISGNCKGLFKLKIPYCTKVTDRGIVSIARSCRNLLFLDAAQCSNLGDVSAIAIGENCHRMTFLNMWGWRHIGDNGVCAIAKGCKIIQSIGLYDCTAVTDVGLITLAQHCRKHLSGVGLCCDNISTDGLKRLLTKCKGMKNLDLQHSFALDKNKFLDLVKAFKRKTTISTE